MDIDVVIGVVLLLVDVLPPLVFGLEVLMMVLSLLHVANNERYSSSSSSGRLLIFVLFGPSRAFDDVTKLTSAFADSANFVLSELVWVEPSWSELV